MVFLLGDQGFNRFATDSLTLNIIFICCYTEINFLMDVVRLMFIIFMGLIGIKFLVD